MVRLKNGHGSGVGSYAVILLRPIAAVLAAWGVWYPLWSRGWCLDDPDATLFREPFIGFLAAFHAILAGFAANKVWTERTQALRSIRLRDEEGFALALRDRIPRDIHLLIGSMSVLIWIAVAVLPYDTVFAGLFAVGSVSFILATYWQLATTLDDSLKDPEVMREIPREWLQQGDDGKFYPRCMLQEVDPPTNSEEDDVTGLS